MSYYVGDARGDVWGNIGRTFKRAARDVGKVAKAALPFAPLIPLFGAATAVGRLSSLHGKVIKQRDLAQASLNSALGVGVLPPSPQPELRVATRAEPPAVPGQSKFATRSSSRTTRPKRRATTKRRTTARRSTTRRSSR